MFEINHGENTHLNVFRLLTLASCRWHADGINCSLSTDDSGVMQNTLSEEYERGRKDGLSNDDLVEMVCTTTSMCGCTQVCLFELRSL